MRLRVRLVLIALSAAISISTALAEVMPPRKLIAREGKGYLEKIGPELVLHLKGSPAEMGHQHGVLMKSRIQSLVGSLETMANDKGGPLATLGFALINAIWKKELKYVQPRYDEELRALAEGAGVTYERAARSNAIPELFHCSGFALWNAATKDGTLYHGRILDYGTNMKLQDYPVIVIAEPDGYASFVNVTYAGFIGSVTGMNANGIGFGEMGGHGQGQWDGTPMSFLMRQAIEESKTLDDAKRIFSESKRTCEYYYVFSDWKIPSAVGVAATPDSIEFIGPNELREPLNVPIKDGVVLSADERYKLLTQRIQEKWGQITPSDCRAFMKRPVSMKENLHCVLMCPKTQELWVAHATSKGEPASEQPYIYLNIAELRAKEPK